MQRWRHFLSRRLVQALIAATGLFACARPGTPAAASADAGRVAATFRGGAVSLAEVESEANRLTPGLRDQFASRAGREALVLSLIDKKLLAGEARHRGLDRDPELQRQVRDLESRLLIKALVSDEEKALGPPTDTELRAYYAAHRDRYALPERVRLARVLVRAGAGGPADKASAQLRAQKLRARLIKGEALASVEQQAEGPERARGGELGTFSQGDFMEPSVGRAAFALERPGSVSPVLSTRDGFAVLQLLERLARRTPPFEEVRPQVAAELSVTRQRQAFDALRKRLRQAADVHLEASAAR